ncbi:hypothetical protein [Proteiniborus sp. MB09-C3]|nr:hypothetical protein [Proteiniborus sp. MB09-C3]WIV13651.1 hypothetical protein QO263_08090 [Proteiniborus sp. MB09-C3]
MIYGIVIIIGLVVTSVQNDFYIIEKFTEIKISSGSLNGTLVLPEVI